MLATRVLIDSLTHADAKCENQSLVFHSMTQPIRQPSIVYSIYQIPCVYLGCKFSGSYHRLPTLSRTFIAEYICLTKNKIWVFHPGRDLPHLTSPKHTKFIIIILCIHESILDVVPISELTTHSPRIVNNQYHVPTPDSTRCNRAYEMKSCHCMLCHATCNIYKFRIIIFPTYNFHSS